MCLATPMKIIKIDGKKAVVGSGQHLHEADLSLVKNVEVGNYVLVHGDMVINKLEKQEAEKILEIISNCNHCHECK